jgi:hypothetical protein
MIFQTNRNQSSVFQIIKNNPLEIIIISYIKKLFLIGPI